MRFFEFLFSALIIISKDESVGSVAEANCILFWKGHGVKGKVCSHDIAAWHIFLPYIF